MHVHVNNHPAMRTTIELSDEQRAELMRLAARRHLKGFSVIVQEAVDAYLQQRRMRESAVATALALEGTLTGSSADEFEGRVRLIREHWR
jgi:predicted transcriptional regulator